MLLFLLLLVLLSSLLFLLLALLLMMMFVLVLLLLVLLRFLHPYLTGAHGRGNLRRPTPVPQRRPEAAPAHGWNFGCLGKDWILAVLAKEEFSAIVYRSFAFALFPLYLRAIVARV